MAEQQNINKKDKHTIVPPAPALHLTAQYVNT